MRTIAASLALGLVVSSCGSGNGGGTEAEPHSAPAPSPAPARDAGARSSDPPPPPSDSAPDASVDPTPPPPAAPPFSGPGEQWAWVDLSDTVCADGSQTGVGVNLTTHSNDVLIFLEGGGACWDANGCWGAMATAFYMSGYGKAAFDGDPQRSIIPLQRDNANNPFRTMNMVYVPYCTGDVHGGNRLTTYQVNGAPRPTYHYGARNITAILAHAAATFPYAKHVWIAGDSAGGFGAALNLPRARAAFPGARVGVLDDSGQPVQPAPDRWKLWRDAWGLVAPPGCTACDDDVGAYVDFYRTHYSDSPFGLISFEADAVISTFMGLSAAQFQDELNSLTARMDHDHYGGYFLVPGSLHVGMLAANTPELDAWIGGLVTDDPTWASVKQ
jgi:hypothetical protein